MVESGPRELHHTAARENPDTVSGHEAADARHRPQSQRDRAGHGAEPRQRHGEQQFVVIAAGERVFARQFAPDGASERFGHRQRRGIDFRAATACGAELLEVAAQAVRDVDAGAGEAPQRNTDVAARRREQEPVAQDLGRHRVSHVQPAPARAPGPRPRRPANR